jgi:hypothetical protein
MAFEQKENSGALFKNNKTKDTQPDYTGDAMVNGQKVRISAWIKKSARGTAFMSLAFSEPREASDAPPRREPGNMPPLNDGDSDIPF